MAVTPDPVGSYLSAFQAADTSRRDLMRLALQQKQMEENAVQRARENKANDFKQMLAAMDGQTDREYKQFLMTKGDDGLRVQAYNAETSRYNALNRKSGNESPYSDDPLGLASGGGSPLPAERAPVIPPAALPSGESTFTPASGRGASTFGDDLPMSAASPPDYSLFPTVPPPLPDGEEGPVGPPGPAPSAAAAPLRAVPMGEPALPRAVPMAEVVEEQAALDTPSRDLTPQETLRAFMPPVVPAAPADSGEQALLPPPVAVPSFTEQDVSVTARDGIINLEREGKEELRKAAILQAEANKTAGYLGRSNLRDPEAYRNLAKQQQAASIDAAGKANEAVAKADSLKAELPKLQKRQELLSSLADLETVLPPNEMANLIGIASDPSKGGQVDKQLSTLSAYQKVRTERGLRHTSRGMATAADVARAGAQLYTPDAVAERIAHDAWNAAKTGYAASKDTDPDEAKMWRTEMIKNTAKAKAWEIRDAVFNEAVRRDTQPEKPVAEEVSVAPKPAADTPPPPAATPPGIGLEQETPETRRRAEIQLKANDFWTEGKNQAKTLAKLDQATDAELKRIAQRDAQPGQMRGLDTMLGLSQYNTVTDSLAERIRKDFKMPANGQDSGVRGRLGNVDVSDFLAEAAREELLRRNGPAALRPSISEESRKKAANIKI